MQNNNRTVTDGTQRHQELPDKSYLVVAQTTTKVKNKLQEDIADLLDNENRKIVRLDGLPDFLVELNAKINEVNNRHRRCTSVKAITMSQWDWEDAINKKLSDIHLSTNERQFIITLYQIKEEI